MKILQQNVRFMYRFRCKKCRSLYEMDECEKLENDWKYGEYTDRKENRFPYNPLNKFYCPVCNAVEAVRFEDIHKYAVMDDGTMIEEY